MLWLLNSASAAVTDRLEVDVETVVSPPRTGDPKADYWEQYQVLGTFTNRSNDVVELPGATIVFHGSDGRMLGIDSIGTAAKRDAGDDSPGENVFAEVHYVRPGETVPFHFLRNLAAFDGPIDSQRVEVRPSFTVPGTAPHGAWVDRVDTVRPVGSITARVLGGALRNDGDAPCRAPALVVGLTDAAGHLREVRSYLAVDDLQFVLEPGQSVPVEAKLFAESEGEVRTWVDCRPID